MAITGTVGWILKENLPGWQAALRAQADKFAMMVRKARLLFIRSSFGLPSISADS
jgi:hypothetical protein